MRMLLILVFVFHFISSNCISQNLIINGNFEDVNICTEHHAPCAPEAWRLTSSLIPEYSINNKNHTVGIIVKNSSIKNVRSYLQSRLSNKLSIGKRYKITMDICPGNIFINEIGIVFSDTLILTKSNRLLKINPELEFENNKKLLQYKKGKDWLRLEKEFIAKNEDLYVIIGCFLNDEDLITKYSKGKFRAFKNYHYYFDNIKLIPMDTIYDNKNIADTKKLIYSEDYRHPVPDDFLVQIKPQIILEKINSDSFISNSDTILLFGNLLFEFDSYIPSDYLVKKVDSIFNNLTCSIDSFSIIGHTDKIGTDSYNNELSFKRAESVANYIITSGFIKKDKIRIMGYGSKFPIENNSTDTLFYKNRRVEVIIYNSE